MGYKFYPNEQVGILIAKQPAIGDEESEEYIDSEQATINALVAEAETQGLFVSSIPGRYLGFNLGGADETESALNNTRAIAVLCTEDDRPAGAPSLSSDEMLIDTICALFPPNV